MPALAPSHICGSTIQNNKCQAGIIKQQQQHKKYRNTHTAPHAAQANEYSARTSALGLLLKAPRCQDKLGADWSCFLCCFFSLLCCRVRCLCDVHTCANQTGLLTSKCGARTLPSGRHQTSVNHPFLIALFGVRAKATLHCKHKNQINNVIHG